jgi:hypothetical protein
LRAFGADDNATRTIGLRINKPKFWWLTLKEQKWSSIRERRGFSAARAATVDSMVALRAEKRHTLNRSGRSPALRRTPGLLLSDREQRRGVDLHWPTVSSPHLELDNTQRFPRKPDNCSPRYGVIGEPAIPPGMSNRAKPDQMPRVSNAGGYWTSVALGPGCGG